MKYLIIEIDDDDDDSKRNYYSKLTEEDVKNIRAEYSANCMRYSDLAKKYDVHQTTIGRIIRRQDWVHVK
jgi:Mor family transcriptional regulator